MSTQPGTSKIRLLLLQGVLFCVIASAHAGTTATTTGSTDPQTSNPDRSSIPERIFLKMWGYHILKTSGQKASTTPFATATPVMPKTTSTRNSSEVGSTSLGHPASTATTTIPASTEQINTSPTSTAGVSTLPEKGSAAPLAKKRNLIYAMTEALLPTDDYTKKGFSSEVTYILYALSFFIAASGTLLLTKKPRVLAKRVESIFNFA